jgi:probable addiction module antidote protein
MGGVQKMVKDEKREVDYDSFILDRLQNNPNLIPEYLKAAFDDFDESEDFETLLVTIRMMAKAKKGGITAIAKEAGISRQQLYKTLSSKGNPTIKSLHRILKTLGCKLTIAQA